MWVKLTDTRILKEHLGSAIFKAEKLKKIRDTVL